ncbi:sulfatase-like hydrolase/transferase [Paenibacillus cremeus]|uniref:sulfatase-like hydrolase/transferase n=1 Tax=Paenibacillus cremeus TaxID=2163881 RepID=UPI001C944EE8|nr:sulfatase-like hydrolase/transferase [Paenibacillus cremeus]
MLTHPNILLITTDQQRWDCLGMVGAGHPVMTPHLDQLAAEGIRFRRAYSDCPICIPARTTIMTGLSADRHGLANMSETAKPFPEASHRTLPGRLTAAGYQTHAAGKMHFTPARARYGFERMRLLPEDYVNWLEGTPYAGMYRGHGLGGNEVYPAFASTPVQYTQTHWIVNESIDFLRQRDPHAPFFMWTSFETPHPPFDPPESYVRLYDGIDIPKPSVGDWSRDAEDKVPRWITNVRWSRKLDQLPEAVVQAARKHYYAQITHIDYELGRLLGELNSQGIAQDTIILFTSDHGEMLGDHGLFHKTAFYEPSAGVPFILRIPKAFLQARYPAYAAGRVFERGAQLADIYPTLLDLAGVWSEEEQSERDGCSLLRMDESELEERWLFGYVEERDGLFMAANVKWKYLYYVDGGFEQLFNLEQDPLELHNLAADTRPECGAMLNECRHQLRERFPAWRDDDNATTGLRATDKPLREERQVKAANPFAWRGPIRYGKGY